MLKILFNRQAMLHILSNIKAAVPVRTTMPVLKCVKIDAQSSSVVQVIASSGDTFAMAVLSQCEVKEAGIAAIDAEQLLSICSSSDDDTLTITASDEKAVINDSASKFTSYVFPAGMFPAMPQIKDGQKMASIKRDDLATSIRKTIICASPSDKSAMGNILIRSRGNDTVMFVGCSGKTLSEHKISYSGEFPAYEGDILLPRTSALCLMKILATAGEDVSLAVDGNKIMFFDNGFCFVSSLAHGQYPNYSIIIRDRKDDAIMTVGVADFVKCIKKAMIFTAIPVPSIRLEISKDNAVITSYSPERGDSRVNVAVKYGGEDITIGVNPQFILDELGVISNATVEMQIEPPIDDKPRAIMVWGDKGSSQVIQPLLKPQ